MHYQSLNLNLLLNDRLQEVDETQSSQGSSVTFLDGDTFRNEVQLAQEILTVRLLMQIIDDTDQTRLQLLDTVTATDFANQSTYLLVKILVFVHPSINYTSRYKLILITM